VDAVLDMLADDHVNNANAVVVDEDGDVVVLEVLLKSSIIDTYIVAIVELYRSQYSTSFNKEPILYSATLKALLECHR
jgi:hypothetical protein